MMKSLPASAEPNIVPHSFVYRLSPRVFEWWYAFHIFYFQVFKNTASQQPWHQRFFSTVRALFIRPQKILFYPAAPDIYSIPYKLGLRLKTVLTKRTHSKRTIIMKWDPSSCSPNDDFLDTAHRQSPVINYRCVDVRKSHLDHIMKKTWGYGLGVDPLSHHGPMVCKSDWNARHDGEVIHAPITSTKEHCVYQRLIDNTSGDGLVMDIRIPVFRGQFPFVYLKFRPISDRFSNTNLHARMEAASHRLSSNEQKAIAQFCNELGLEYGELDVLRDRNDHRLYVVDANNTPSGPPNHLAENFRGEALQKLSHAFRSAFLEGTEGRRIQNPPGEPPLDDE